MQVLFHDGPLAGCVAEWENPEPFYRHIAIDPKFLDKRTFFRKIGKEVELEEVPYTTHTYRSEMIAKDGKPVLVVYFLDD